MLASRRHDTQSDGRVAPAEVGRAHHVARGRHLPARNTDRPALVAAAEETLASAGCGLLEITSNVRLVGAHEFYEYLGYERTSIRLAKVLTPAR